MTETPHPELRLEELLVEQTDRSLGFDESAEVQKLARELSAAGWHGEDLELAAAATLLAFESKGIAELPALPVDLRERVREQAQAILDEEGEEAEAEAREALGRDDTVKTTIPLITAESFESANTLVPAQKLEAPIPEVFEGELSPRDTLEQPRDPSVRDTLEQERAKAVQEAIERAREISAAAKLMPQGAAGARDTLDPAAVAADPLQRERAKSVKSAKGTFDPLASANDPSTKATLEPSANTDALAIERLRAKTPREPIAQGSAVVELASDLAAGADDTRIAPAPQLSGDKVIRLRARRIAIIGLAAAASIGVAILGYALFAGRDVELPAPAGGSFASMRDQLSKEAGAFVGKWSGASDPLGASVAGDVVWSDAKQSGFMRFIGLAKNDPAKTQYQLWIFDAERDERYPVDGGVFDVDRESGEVIVRIDPKIRVTKATLFAVTIERPGGVVVSTRERLVVVAKVI